MFYETIRSNAAALHSSALRTNRQLLHLFVWDEGTHSYRVTEIAKGAVFLFHSTFCAFHIKIAWDFWHVSKCKQLRRAHQPRLVVLLLETYFVVQHLLFVLPSSFHTSCEILTSLVAWDRLFEGNTENEPNKIRKMWYQFEFKRIVISTSNPFHPPLPSPTNNPTFHITLEAFLDTAQPALLSSFPPEMCSHQSNPAPFPPAIFHPPASPSANNSRSFWPVHYTQPTASFPTQSMMDEYVPPIRLSLPQSTPTWLSFAVR